MTVDITTYYFVYLSVTLALTAALSVIMRKTKNKYIGFFVWCMTYYAAYALMALAYGAVFVFYIRNGYSPDLGNIGITFVFGAVFGSFLIKRLGLAPDNKLCAAAPAYFLSMYYLFIWIMMMIRYGTGGSLGYLSYAVKNCVFGFIGISLLSDSRVFFIHALTAIMPLITFIIGNNIFLSRGKRCRIQY